ncbi:LysR family transcriptional regulator [Thalassotalea ganghwensis]
MFHLLNVYVAVAEEQGFAAGARKLGMSSPAVTRAIATLENDLQVKLLNRTTRQVKMTEIGEKYLTQVKQILSDLREVNALTTGVNSQPVGLLKVTAPILFGSMFITPIITDYLRQYRQTKVDALFVDRYVDLVNEGIDVGVRIGELADSSMKAIKVGNVRTVLCASTQYIKKHGIPLLPNELNTHQLVSSSAIDVLPEWKFSSDKHAVKIKPCLMVNSNDAAISAIRHHAGIGRLLSYQVAPYLANGELKIVLAEFEVPPKPIHIIHRENHLTSSKIRAFIDLLANQLKANKALN